MSENERVMRILLAEDNSSDADLIRTHLGEGQGRYELQRISQIEDVLELLKKADLDVVLLDLNLSGATGLEALERVEPDTTDVPIVVLGAASDDRLAMSCIEAGAQDYLCKREISSVTLRRSINYAISRNQRRKVGTLEDILQGYEKLTSTGAVTSVTKDLSGQGSLQRRALEQFTEWVSSYRQLLEAYRSQDDETRAKRGALMHRVVTQVGNLGGGPRDLNDVHVETLRDVAHGLSHAKAAVYADEAQMLPLEMMGLLVDHYRLGNQRVNHQGSDE